METWDPNGDGMNSKPLHFTGPWEDEEDLVEGLVRTPSGLGGGDHPLSLEHSGRVPAFKGTNTLNGP